MIKTKRRVNVENLDPKLWVAYGVAIAIYEELGNLRNCVITSGNDSWHKIGSLHYQNLAIDIRVWGFDTHTRNVATVMIGSRLSLDYDVINEVDHIHIEWDPKEKT